ncbi:hypothetical protein [Alishewanella longhuensis]
MQKVGGGAAGFDFTKLDANGNDLPESAKLNGAGAVRDNHTGLIWEEETGNDGGLRDMNHTYTWYNPDMNSNGGDAGFQYNTETCIENTCDTYSYVTSVNKVTLCGANNGACLIGKSF